MALFLTKAGLAALVEAEESGTKLQATDMALGDGNGSVPEHTTSSPSLINEVWRGALQSITVNEQGDTDAGKQVVFEAHVPINAGGWYIREVALYADDVLLAIGTHPVMWKPAPEEPTKMEHVIKAPVTFGNADAVPLIVDPAVVLASQEFVNKQIVTHDDSQEAHPHFKKLLDEHSHRWDEVQNKPNVFPPKSHGHDWNEVSGKPAAFPPSGHDHDSRYYTEAEVDGKIGALQDNISSKPWCVDAEKEVYICSETIGLVQQAPFDGLLNLYVSSNSNASVALCDELGTASALGLGIHLNVSAHLHNSIPIKKGQHFKVTASAGSWHLKLYPLGVI